MNKTLAAKQAVIFQTAKIDKQGDGKIYYREQKGRFQQLRRYLSGFLIGVFILLPWLNLNGKQAILFDVAEQQFHIFSLVLFPQDFTLFMGLFIFAAFLLFFITRLYGRIWCGYTCPQTVWMLMFNWIERRVEGSHSQSKTLDNAPMSFNKGLKKAIKHSLWIIVAMLSALAFMSYFIPAKQLYINFIQFEASFLVQAWVYFFAVCTYINAAWVKEKMCLHMCPYARFQSAMFIKSTTLMAYDNKRGENRGPRKIKHDKPKGKGDCVDCNLCVQVCPVGIDIREGLQYECINCGLCADACDAVMSKFDYAKGLIRYHAETKPAKGLGFNHVYAALTLFSLCLILVWFEWRAESEINVLRDRQALYRINTQGKSENTYIIKTLNKSQTNKVYLLQTSEDSLVEIISPTTFEVAAGQLHTQAIAVADKQVAMLKNQQKLIKFKITDTYTGEVFIKDVSFYQSDKGW